MTEAKRQRVPRGLKREGAAIWSYGFRPFFLSAGVWAILSMALWIAALIHGLPLGGEFGAPLWHAHEMVFGFASAVLAGFLLTAIPNWTGSLPVSGWPLIGLFVAWFAGRAAMAAAGIVGTTVASTIDSAFLPLLLLIAGREIITGRKWNDLKVLAAVAAIMSGNLGFHLAVWFGADPALWLRAAIAGYVAMITIIGGRIIPSFTRNWLNQRRQGPLPVAYNGFDRVVIGLSAVTLALWVILPEVWFLIPVALITAVMNLVRLARWRGISTRAEWLLLVLHIAYGFVVLGFLAIAGAAAGVVQPVSGLHVLTVGAIGLMMLAVMGRATRGHTGRALTASRLTQASYLCVILAALARPMADLSGQMILMEASGLLWMLGFGLFIAEHAAMLLCVRRAPVSRTQG